jgi:hypothetical protein
MKDSNGRVDLADLVDDLAVFAEYVSIRCFYVKRDLFILKKKEKGLKKKITLCLLNFSYAAGVRESTRVLSCFFFLLAAKETDIQIFRSGG